ncbi:WGR domain-containing protein, partial [Escherichia coli]
MRHFIYQDEKSHKFWAVEQQDNELHISWGKVGTNGQSQIKSFSDAAAAAKAELKLIAEKTKKGYVENASANVHISPITKATPEVETSPESKNQRPWLADDAVIPVTDDINRFAFPHRSRPREINYLRKDGEIWKRIADNTRAYDPDNNYRAYPENWQQAFAELQMRILGNQQTGSVQSDAALLWSFWNSYSADELVDDLVIRCGLDSAVEIALLALQLRYNPVKRAVTTIIPPNHEAESLPNWHQRLCHHLSLASEDEWQRCVDKVLAAIPTLSPARQPFAALLIPERPDIANAMALHYADQNVPAMTWLSMMVSDDVALATLEKYGFPPLYNDFRKYLATLLANNGMRGVSRILLKLPVDYPVKYTDLFTNIHANAEDLVKWLWKTNHPDAIQILILGVIGKKKHLEYLSKASQKHPAAAIAAYATLLAIHENKEWRKALVKLITATPELVCDVIPWVNAKAAGILSECRPQPVAEKCEYATVDMLPELLVSPPWMTKEKKKNTPVFDLPVLPVPSVSDVTPEITKKLTRTYLVTHFQQIAQQQATKQTLFTDLPPIKKASWEKHLIPLTPEQQILWHLGFEKWRESGEKIYEKVPAPQSAVDALLRFDFPALNAEFVQYHNNAYKSWNLIALCYLPGQQAISFLNQIVKEDNYSGEGNILAIFGSAAIPAFMACLQRDPRRLCFFPFFLGVSELALPMAQQLQKKMSYEDARNWLTDYPRHAAAGLLPVALGKKGKDRDCARQALRLLVNLNQRETIEEIAQGYNQPDVLAALATLFDSDPLEEYPAKIAPLSGFYQFTLWRRPRLKSNNLPLSDDAMRHLGTMLSFPRDITAYAGLDIIREIFTRESLAEFGWDLYTAWTEAGAPAKENWAFTSLGILGNDDTARKLTPLIRAWPGESQHKRAVSGLDVLADIGSDVALMLLNGIARKIKFKALQEHAREKINIVAENRGLTMAELEDRLAPDLRLDSSGSLILDFGPRKFTVGFDETLKPVVCDANGKVLKDLPKPNQSDDKTLATDAVNLFKQLKKDVRAIASQQITRLEQAMCQRRRWTAEQFSL